MTAASEHWLQAFETLTAENERLRETIRSRASEYYEAYQRHTGELAALRAENERLRAALAEIEAGFGRRLSAAELASMARQAL